MSEKLPVPFNGRIAGFALALLAVAVGVRVAWMVIEPVRPSVLGLVAMIVVYRVMLGRSK